MLDESPPRTPRRHYRPSGRVDAGRFVPLAIAVLGVALGYAWLLWQGFERRFYVPVLFVVGGGMIVGALALGMVRWGHCRSPGLVLGLGGLASALLAPGPHVLAYLHDGGLEQGVDARLFFDHVDRRFNSASIKWIPNPRVKDWDEAEDPDGGDRLILWIAAVLEVLGAFVFGAVPAWLRVRRHPYCETGGEWSRARRIAFQPLAADTLRQALEEGQLAALAPLFVTEYKPNQPCVLAILHTCAEIGGAGPAYLSFRVHDGTGAGALAFDELFPYYLSQPRCAELEREEAAALAALIPPDASGGTASILPAWYRDLLEETPGDGDAARIEDIAQPHPPPALNRASRRWAEALNLAPLLICTALGLGAIWIGGEGDVDGVASPASIVAFFALTIIGLVITLRDSWFVGSRYLLRRLAARLVRRPDPLVRFGDPGVLQVALLPRGAWNHPNPIEGIDYGLLVVRDDTVLYEGDRLRMKIPAKSLLAIYLEPLVVDQYQTWQFVVLEVRGKEGRHTLPLMRVACSLGETLVWSRRRRANVLLAHLTAIAPHPEGEDPVTP